MIHVRHLAKSFNGVPVLRDVDAHIEKGEVISIVGPSGTGKSTFLRCLNLLERPDAGDILVNGKSILRRGTDPAALRMKMGMVFQQFNLFPHLNVLENVTLAPRTLRGLSADAAETKARALLERVGLAHKADALPDELSGGQQQRIAIARTLAMEPEIVLFDEPTSALDPTMVSEVLAVIRDLAGSGMTLMIVTHEMRFARDVSTRVFYMDEGVIYEEGPPARVFDAPLRDKTRAFIQRIHQHDFTLERDAFDLYAFLGQADAFAARRMVPAPARMRLQLLLEELVLNLLFHRVENVRLSIGVPEGSALPEIQAVYPLPTFNPFAETDENLALPRMMVEKLCASIRHSADASNNTLHLTLAPPS